MCGSLGISDKHDLRHRQPISVFAVGILQLLCLRIHAGGIGTYRTRAASNAADTIWLPFTACWHRPLKWLHETHGRRSAGLTKLEKILSPYLGYAMGGKPDLSQVSKHADSIA